MITEKDVPLSVRHKIIQNAVDQIIRSNELIILIHGGGSFGHPLAKKFEIQNGFNNKIENQRLGLSKTHFAMEKLNSIVIESFLKKNHPAISISPSSVHLNSQQSIKSFPTTIIEKLLSLKILPILYGDIILDEEKGFSIISGDRIILEICKNLQNYRVKKVIFCLEKDGLFKKQKSNKSDDNEGASLIRNIKHNSLDNLDIANFKNKIDVTGGIKGKLEEIKQICKLKIPVQLVNGLKENYIFNALKNQDVLSTLIN